MLCSEQPPKAALSESQREPWLVRLIGGAEGIGGQQALNERPYGEGRQREGRIGSGRVSGESRTPQRGVPTEKGGSIEAARIAVPPALS